MRLFAIAAVFVLAIVAVVEGAMLVRLSGRLDRLAQVGPAPAEGRVATERGPARARTEVALPPPRLVPAAAPADDRVVASPPEVLRAALDTAEGRQHLKAAIEVLREQDRQDRIATRAERDVEREQRRKEQLTRVLNLSSEEQGRVGQLFATLQGDRARVVGEMRAGGKSADDARDAIDKLEEQSDQALRGLLGEERMRQYRAARRQDRLNDRNNDRRDGGAPR